MVNGPAREVDSTEARKLRKASAVFYGYDWTIDSIRFDGEIYGPAREKPRVDTDVAAA